MRSQLHYSKSKIMIFKDEKARNFMSNDKVSPTKIKEK